MQVHVPLYPYLYYKLLVDFLITFYYILRSISGSGYIKQLKIDVPAGIQPTHQLLVRYAHSAAESVLPSSACAAIYGVMRHVHISNTPSSTNVIVELDGHPRVLYEVRDVIAYPLKLLFET